MCKTTQLSLIAGPQSACHCKQLEQMLVEIVNIRNPQDTAHLLQDSLTQVQCWQPVPWKDTIAGLSITVEVLKRKQPSEWISRSITSSLAAAPSGTSWSSQVTTIRVYTNPPEVYNLQVVRLFFPGGLFRPF